MKEFELRDFVHFYGLLLDDTIGIEDLKNREKFELEAKDKLIIAFLVCSDPNILKKPFVTPLQRDLSHYVSVFSSSKS